MPVFSIEFDASGVRVGAGDAERALRKLGDEAGKAEKCVKGIGTEAGKAEKGVRDVGSAAAASAKQLDAIKAAMAGVGAGMAGLAIVAKTLDFAKAALSAASHYETLGVVVHQVGKNAGYSAVEVDKNVNAVRRMGIAGAEARQTMTKLIQAQVDISKAPDLARIAQDAAVIGGINSSEAFERMVHGIQSAQSQILRGIGINVDFERSYQKMAVTLGKSVSALTEQEKTQARANSVMEEGSKIAGTYEAAMATLSKQMGNLSRIQDDFFTDTGKFLLNIASGSGAVSGYTKVLEGLNGAILVMRGAMAGVSTDELLRAAHAGKLQGLREITEMQESVHNAFASFDAQRTAFEKRGLDVSLYTLEAQALRDMFFGTRQEIENLEKDIFNFERVGLDTSSKRADLEELRIKLAALGITAEDVVKSLEKIGVNMRRSTEFDAHVKDFDALWKKYAEVDTAFAKTSGVIQQQKLDSLSTLRTRLKEGYDAGRYTAEEFKKMDAGFAKELESIGKRGASAAAKMESAARAIKGIDAEIAKLRGDFAESYDDKLEMKLDDIAKRGKEAGLALDFVRQKQQEYATAFSKEEQRKHDHSAAKVHAEIAGMQGNKELERQLQLEDAILQKKRELLATPPPKLDVEGQRQFAEWAERTAKAWGDAKKQEIQVKDMQTAVSFMKELEQMSGQYGLSIEMNNRLIEQQAKLMGQNSNISREHLQQWEWYKKLESARDPLSGIHRSAIKYMAEAGDYGKQLEDVMTNAFKGAEDAIVQFCMTGKLNFTQLANSIIADLVRIAARQAVSGIAGSLVSGIGNLFSGFGGGGTTSTSWNTGGFVGSSSLTTYGAMPWAKGGALTGGDIAAYRNQIVSSPTFFTYDKQITKYAQGGVMGEAGEEAIMPLKRGPGGRLGIEAYGFGGNAQAATPVINIDIHTPPGVATKTERKPNQQGGFDMRFLMEMVDNATAEGIFSGRSKTANAIKMQNAG